MIRPTTGADSIENCVQRRLHGSRAACYFRLPHKHKTYTMLPISLGVPQSQAYLKTWLHL